MEYREEEIRPPRATPDEIAEEELVPQPQLMPEKAAPNLKGLAKDGGMVKNIIIALAVVLVVIVGMGAMGGGSFVLKKDFETNWANMEAATKASVAELNQLRDTVNNAAAGIPSMINSQVSTSISQATNQLTAQLNEFTNKLNDNVTAVENAVTRISALEAENTALEARILALEEKKPGTTSGDKDTDMLEVNMGYSNRLLFPKDVATTGDVSIYFEVDNTLDVDVENINVELVIHSRGRPINLSNTLCKVSGGWPLQWQKVYVGNGICVLQGITPTYGDGMDIDAGDDAAMFVTVELAVATADIPTEDITFYVEGEVTSYDIKE